MTTSTSAKMTPEEKAALRRRIAESFLLFGAPWIVVYVVLRLVQGTSGSTPWSGFGKLLLLLVSAFSIVAYELWFIRVIGRGLEDESKDTSGESRYGFSQDFLSKPADATVDGALEAWRNEPTPANKAKALEEVRRIPDNNEQFKRLTQVVDKLQSRIGEEYSDIHSRTGWLVAGQAFLLTAFVSVLNAEPLRLSPDLKQWLSIGIGLTGAGISFVLALSIFYGTALIEVLKGPRDQAEDMADEVFKVPRTGVKSKTGVHVFSHYATRYIPCLAYIAWIALTLLAMNGTFSQAVQTPSGGPSPPGGNPPPGPPTPGGNPPTPGGNPTSRRGWKPLESSPSFALGSADLNVPDCPDPKKPQPESRKTEVDAWRNGVLTAWHKRASAAKSDVLILVGSADRITLRGALRHQYDTNMGLARDRAETVKTLLITETDKAPGVDKLSLQRIVVLVTGPQHSPEAVKPTAGQEKKNACEAFRDDRRVQVWMPSGE